jgi:predicted short-subunit dehydrogenase-like oxidoreductase (DUF2520 family)
LPGEPPPRGQRRGAATATATAAAFRWAPRAGRGTARTHALLAISDRAIEPFVQSHPELGKTVRIHFSGRLANPLAIGAHPLFSFAGTFYERELNERIPFVIDQGCPPLASLIPGLPNPSFFIEPGRRERYHALCVLAGNFTTLLWRKLFFELDAELGMPREQVLPYLESITRGLGGTGLSLSGPLSRGDRTTLQRNLEALKSDPCFNSRLSSTRLAIWPISLS